MLEEERVAERVVGGLGVEGEGVEGAEGRAHDGVEGDLLRRRVAPEARGRRLRQAVVDAPPPRVEVGLGPDGLGEADVGHVAALVVAAEGVGEVARVGVVEDDGEVVLEGAHERRRRHGVGRPVAEREEALAVARPPRRPGLPEEAEEAVAERVGGTHR